MKMTLVRKVSATWFSRGPTLRPAGSHQVSEGPNSKSPDVTTKPVSTGLGEAARTFTLINRLSSENGFPKA